MLDISRIDPDSRKRRCWNALVIGVITAGLLSVGSLSSASERDVHLVLPSPAKESPDPLVDQDAEFSIPPRGRLTVQQSSISAHTQIPLVFTIEDEGSPTDPRKTRVVAVAGRRFDGDAIPVAGKTNRFVIQVPAAFLEVGLYMIEVDAVDSHPIDMRRFVVEVRP